MMTTIYNNDDKQSVNHQNISKPSCQEISLKVLRQLHYLTMEIRTWNPCTVQPGSWWRDRTVHNLCNNHANFWWDHSIYYTTIHFRCPSLTLRMGAVTLLLAPSNYCRPMRHLKGPELTLLSAWLHRALKGDPNSPCLPGGGSKSAEKTDVMVDLAPKWHAEESFRKHCCRSKGNWIFQELKITITIYIHIL